MIFNRFSKLIIVFTKFLLISFFGFSNLSKVVKYTSTIHTIIKKINIKYKIHCFYLYIFFKQNILLFISFFKTKYTIWKVILSI